MVSWFESLLKQDTHHLKSNHRHMPRKTPKRSLFQKDLLQTLHGPARDAAGEKGYGNAEIVADVLALAEGGVASTGPYSDIFVLDSPLQWSGETHICNGCHNIFPRAMVKTCKGCKITYYCSTKCQGAHWHGGHWGLCKSAPDVLESVRPMYKGLDAIERIVVELNATVSEHGMQTTAEDSEMGVFMREQGIEADCFMAIPMPLDANGVDKMPDTIGIAFFQSAKVLAYLNAQFGRAMDNARGKACDTAERKRATDLAKHLRQQMERISGKNPGQLLIMGSFDGHPLAVGRMKLLMHNRFIEFKV